MAKKSEATKIVKQPTANAEDADLSYLQEWAKNKNVKKSAEELEIRIREIFKEIKTAKPSMGNDEAWGKARTRLYAELKSDMKSPAASWLIRVDWMSDAFDYGYPKYMKQIDIYNKNPDFAKKNGIVRVETDKTGLKKRVVPLDSNENTRSGKANRNKGKPLPEHEWIQSLGGLAMPLAAYDADNWDTLKPGEITVSHAQADPTGKHYALRNVEVGKWYQVKLVNKTSSENLESWELNVSQMSKFEEHEGAEITDIPSYYGTFYTPISELSDYHDAYAEQGKDKEGKANPHSTISRRILCTMGNVIEIVPGEDGNNTRISIDDESIGLDTSESITCWFPSTMKIPFGRFSTIYIFGDSSRSQKKDLATGEWLDEWGLPNINAKGFQVIELVEPEIEDEIGGDDHESPDIEGDVDIDEPDAVADVIEKPEELEEEPEEEPEAEPPKEEPAKKPEKLPLVKKSTIAKKTSAIPKKTTEKKETAPATTSPQSDEEW
jgi:hypothetical protein